MCFRVSVFLGHGGHGPCSVFLCLPPKFPACGALELNGHVIVIDRVGDGHSQTSMSMPCPCSMSMSMYTPLHLNLSLSLPLAFPL